MSLQTVAALAVRVTGIVIGLYAIKAGAAYVYTASEANEDPWLFLALTPTAMMVSASACMIFFPRIIAGKLVPVVKAPAGGDGADAPPAPALGDLAGLGCALLGLYFLIQAVLEVAWLISYYFAAVALGYEWIWTSQTAAAIPFAAAEFAAALWLLLGAKGFVTALRWAKRVHAD